MALEGPLREPPSALWSPPSSPLAFRSLGSDYPHKYCRVLQIFESVHMFPVFISVWDPVPVRYHSLGVEILSHF